MKTAAIVCAQGMGDGLLMMIVAHQLKRAGYTPTIYHNHVNELSLLFEDVTILPHPPLESLKKTLNPFDRVIIENDNSERAWHLFKLRDQKKLDNLSFFFPTPCRKYETGDFLFNPKLSVASNLRIGCEKALQLSKATKDNGIKLPSGKTYRKFPARIVIHPTSQDPKRNWRPSQFLRLAKLLKKEGFLISFTVSPSERKEWLHVEKEGFMLPPFANLGEVAAYLYESGFLIGNDSGIGHLASNLQIPTLTISGNPKRVRLWKPDWHHGSVVTLPFPLPNFKGIHFRFRENFWQHFISVPRTLRAFHLLKESI